MPHSGQLRYHDFAKLRELYYGRLRSSSSSNSNSSSVQVKFQNQATRYFHAASLTPSTNNSSRMFPSSPLSPSLSPSLVPSLSLQPTSVRTSTGTGTSTRRTFFGSSGGVPKFLTDVQLKSLEHQANSAPQDPQAQLAFLQELVKHYPQVVVERVTNPAFSSYAINADVAILALQAAQHTGTARQIDVPTLIQRLVRSSSIHNDKHLTLQLQELLQQYQQDMKQNQHTTSTSNSNSTTTSKAEQIQQLMMVLTGGNPSAAMGMTAMNMMGAGAGGTGMMGALAGGPGGMAMMRGINPKYPLHVEMHQSSNPRAAILGLAGRIVITLVLVSALGAMIDEKGLGKAVGMNQNSKHVQEADQPVKVKFSDVKGVEEAKQELEEIVHYLKDPSKFTRLGGKLPRGLLLTGPPGTGKTLLAKAIAGEAGVPFFFSSGSQFEEVYVGLGAKRVRELFEAAKKKAPAIVFIDEIDAIGGTRKLKDQSALKMTLNELLVQLDGFDENNGIIVIGATNFMESLDDALLRPGRFDKHVTVPLPDVGGRKEILEMYAKKTKLDKSVDLNVLARGTTGMSGAELYNLMNQAALKASVDGLNAITMSVLEYAKDKILMGAERKTAVITKETAKCTAYHEAGHAMMAVLTDGALPIHKATIMPRGNSLGMVTTLPEGDQTSQSLKQMLAMMDVCMGGRVAEELIFGAENVTSGASSDIMQATRIARAMVTKYGFSDQIGIVYHGGATGEEHASDETRAKIDAEVQRLTDAAYQRTKALLTKHHAAHKLLAETLLEYETLTGDEVRDLVKKGRKPDRPIINKAGGSRGDTSILGAAGGAEAKLQKSQ